MTSKYAWDQYNWYWSVDETTFNTPTNTTTNLAADVYYWMPCEHQIKVSHRRVRRMYHRHISGITDEASTGHNGYEVTELTFTGPMWSLDMLLLLCKHADNSGPVSEIYTHDTITTDARTDVSFPMIARQQNATADVLRLFTGCVVKSWDVMKEQGDQAMLNIVVELGREWTGHELTTWPTKPTNPFGASEVTATFKKATAAYDGQITRFHFHWDDRTKLDVYDLHAVDYSYGPRSIYVDFDFVPKAVLDWTDSQDKTNFLLHNRDIDIELNFVRTANEDQVVISMEKLCWIAATMPDFTHNDFYEKRHYRMAMDADETDYKTTITIKDKKDSTRYA